jgi:hypothetical protein
MPHMLSKESLEKELFGLGLEGWIEVFHLKKAKGNSKTLRCEGQFVYGTTMEYCSRKVGGETGQFTEGFVLC